MTTVAQEEKASRFAGWRDELVGTIKERVGRLMKKEDMEKEGKLRREKGQREVAAAKAKKGTADGSAVPGLGESARTESAIPVSNAHRT